MIDVPGRSLRAARASAAGTFETTLPRDRDAPQLRAWIRAFPAVASTLTAAVSCSTLLGWLLDLPLLTRLRPEWVAMMPETALCLLLLGAALGFANRAQAAMDRSWVAAGCASVAVALGSLRFGQHAVALAERAGVRSLVRLRPDGLPPNPMASATAIAFIFVGLGLLALSLRIPHWARWARGCAAVGTVVGILALVGYCYGAEALYTFSPFSSMAVHTAGAFVVLSLGARSAVTTAESLEVISSASSGSVMLRSLLPFAVGLPLAIDWLGLVGQRLSWYEVEVGIGLGTTLHVLIFSALVWRTAARLHHSDAARERVEKDLREARQKLSSLNQDLERRVESRTRELASMAAALETTASELERASERVRLATRALAMGVWDWDVQANVLVWDDGMYRLYGSTSQTFSATYEGWLAAVHPEDRCAADQAVAAALERGGTFDTAFRVVCPDGRIRHIRGTALVHRDEDGRALRMVGINLDITEQRTAELALRARDALLRDFVRHAPAAIAMLDTNLRYLQASDRWLLDYGLGSIDIVGRSHYELFPQADWKETFERVLGGVLEHGDEHRFTRPNGEAEWIQWEARPWHGADGSVGGVMLFTQLITSRKSMELQLKQQTAELERSNRDLEQFAYVASHDLQEPLRAVTGCGQILKQKYSSQLDGHGNDLIQHIVEGGVRMQSLILDLLAYSRVSTRGMGFAAVDSGLALERALAQLQMGIQETGATIDAEPLPTVHGDGVQLTQLFQNLVGNALKYRGAAPPLIRVGAERQGGSWEFFVQDNGIGIDSRYFERIFVIFQRLHTRREYPGTGIGLAICHKIVERHGGRIWVESALGAGSTFRFSLPAGDG